MKVIFKNTFISDLTLDKVYSVDSISYSNPDENGLCNNRYYKILNDNGVYSIYNYKHFITLVEKRDKILNEILN